MLLQKNNKILVCNIKKQLCYTNTPSNIVLYISIKYSILYHYSDSLSMCFLEKLLILYHCGDIFYNHLLQIVKGYSKKIRLKTPSLQTSLSFFLTSYFNCPWQFFVRWFFLLLSFLRGKLISSIRLPNSSFFITMLKC